MQRVRAVLMSLKKVGGRQEKKIDVSFVLLHRKLLPVILQPGTLVVQRNSEKIVKLSC